MAAQKKGSEKTDSNKVQLKYGGPLTVMFHVKTGLNFECLSFAQSRTQGFRKNFEFFNKRVLVADKSSIHIFGYKCDTQSKPFPVAQFNILQIPRSPELDGAVSGSRTGGNLASPKGLGSTDREEILFSAFLSDYDSSLVFLVTYCPERNVSYLKVLKIRNQAKSRSQSIIETDEKQQVIDNLRNDL